MRADVVVLAGGEGRRLGGVSKADVVVAGRALLDHVLDAAAGARRTVVVGPPEVARPGVARTREEPPSGGPVAGIDAGLRHLSSRTDPTDDDVPVLVLACDVPQAAAAVGDLLTALAADPAADGAHLVDASGHAQLVAAYRRGPLTRALAGLAADGGVHGVSVRRLHERLRMVPVADPHARGADADTWDDVRRLDTLLRRRQAMSEDSSDVGAAVGPVPPDAGGSELHRWVVRVTEALGVDPDAVDVEALLDLARDVAHGVARPAVPLTAFLTGYGVARAGGDRAAFEQVTAQVGELARGWAEGDGR